MVSILIMDDQPRKTESVKQILVTDCGINEQSIDCASSIAEGRKRLSENYYDLLILDLVMPLYEGEEANHVEAPNFIDEIFENPSIKEPNQIIGLTVHDEEYDALKLRFEAKLWKLIKYSETDTSWRGKIKISAFHLLRMKRHMLDSIVNKDSYDIGIICALPEEFSYMLEAFGRDSWTNINIPGIMIPLKTCCMTSVMGEEYKIIAGCVGKPGMVGTASMATALFDQTRIDNLFMTGITAGFESDSINLCDIMIAKSSMDYASGKLIEEGIDDEIKIKLLKEIQVMPANMELQSRAALLAEDNELMNRLNQQLKRVHLNADRDSKAHVVPVACGPFVVASKEAVNMIKERDRKLKALDMEAYGLYYAAHLCQKKALWVKGVSDFANSKKDDSCHNKAAYASAYFLYLLIKEMM